MAMLDEKSRRELCLRLICGEQLDLADRCALLDLIDLDGGAPPRPRRQPRLHTRDDAIRAAASLRGGAPSAVAKELSRDLVRYIAAGWPSESALDELPKSASSRRVALHRIARAGVGKSPLGWRQIFRIIAAGRAL
jgi:hypothetical protein